MEALPDKPADQKRPEISTELHCIVAFAIGSGLTANVTNSAYPQSGQPSRSLVNCARQRGQYTMQLSCGSGAARSSPASIPRLASMLLSASWRCSAYQLLPDRLKRLALSCSPANASKSFAEHSTPA